MRRRFEDAAEMYYQTGLRLLNGDKPWTAGSVLGVLFRLDQEKANDLRGKLREAHAAAMAKAAAERQANAPAPMSAPMPAPVENNAAN